MNKKVLIVDYPIDRQLDISNKILKAGNIPLMLSHRQLLTNSKNIIKYFKELIAKCDELMIYNSDYDCIDLEYSNCAYENLQELIGFAVLFGKRIIFSRKVYTKLIMSKSMANKAIQLSMLERDKEAEQLDLIINDCSK